MIEQIVKRQLQISYHIDTHAPHTQQQFNNLSGTLVSLNYSVYDALISLYTDTGHNTLSNHICEFPLYAKFLLDLVKSN